MENTQQKKVLRGKPIKFGFKLRCITSSEGYLVYEEPYCRVDTDLSDNGLGLGANVVLGLTEKCEVKPGSTVTFDNLYTSLPLLHELNEIEIGALGTLHRCHVATVPNKTTLAKNPRGSYDFDTDGKNAVVSWLDNKVVNCATNYVTFNSVSTAQWWSNSHKKGVDVPIPKFFEDYNKQMGGVDLFDQFVSTYRIRIRSKKWWRPFFAWLVNTSVANVWNLFCTLHRQKIGMLEF